MHLQYFLCNTTWNSIKIIFLYGRYYKYDTEIENECQPSHAEYYDNSKSNGELSRLQTTYILWDITAEVQYFKKHNRNSIISVAL